MTTPLRSEPGTKRLQSLHEDGLVGYPTFHTNEQLIDGVNNWLHNWRHRSLTTDYKN
jgi:hypothetical protein